MPYACQRCGLDVPQGVNVCPNCGAAAQRPDAIVRCRHCYRRAPSHLSVCPHCGRKLAPLRPDVPVALASILALILLWFLFRNSSDATTPAKLGDLLAPATATVEPIAIAGNEQATPEKSPLFVNPTPTLPLPTATARPLPTDTPTPRALVTETTVLSATVTVTGTVAAVTTTVATTTASPPPTATALPTATSTALPTATSTALPTATATQAPTATQNPSAAANTYTVKAGDTLAIIAQTVGRSIEAIAAYNGLADVRRLTVGQVLKIPPADYTPPTPVPSTPRPTPTTTPTPAPADTPTPAITIAAPSLVTPGDGSAFRGADALIEFKWQNPGYFPADGQNVIHIGVVTGPGVTEWRLNEPLGGATSYRAPAWLSGQAPAEFGRTYVWYVDVQSSGAPVSPPSPQWRFQWN